MHSVAKILKSRGVKFISLEHLFGILLTSGVGLGCCTVRSQNIKARRPFFGTYPVFQAPPYTSFELSVKVSSKTVLLHATRTKRANQCVIQRDDIPFAKSVPVIRDHTTGLTFKNKQSSLRGAFAGPRPSPSNCGQAFPKLIAFLTAPPFPDALIGTGALKRKGPTGGSANGIPSH